MLFFKQCLTFLINILLAITMKMLRFIMHIGEVFKMLQIPVIGATNDGKLIGALDMTGGSDSQLIDLAKNEIFQ